MMALTPVLSPQGLLTLKDAEAEGPAAAPEASARLVAAFARGPGHGLLSLGADEVLTRAMSLSRL